MLQISSLSYTLNDTPFFENLSATFDAHVLHTITGKNGTGKSTLLKIIHGDIVPTNGAITIHDSIVQLNKTGTAQILKKTIGFVPQHATAVIIPELSVTENLQLAALSNINLFSSLPLPNTTLVEHFNIPLNAQAGSLSGGQKHILAIGMVLQQAKSVLLLDEPMAALDDENASLVSSCIAAIIKSGIIVIMVTHDPLNIKSNIKPWTLKTDAHGIRKMYYL